ncbi:MAG: ATP-binding protein [Candidatus Omnitrophica bacterium]|nr:ATP-binding protein [Candidatus Omnitrophota bacterium]
MKKTFLFKVFVAFSILISAVILIISVFCVRTLKKQSLKNAVDELKNIVETIEFVIQDLSQTKDFEKKLLSIARKTQTRITILTTEGNVLLDSEKDPKEMQNHSDRPEFQQAMKNEYGTSIRWSPTLEEYMVYYAKLDKKKNIVIRASFPLSRQKEEPIGDSFFSLTIVILISGLIISFIMAKILTLPVYEILRFSENIKEIHNVNQSIIKRKDEIGKIMENIRDIATRTKEVFEREKVTEEEIDKFIEMISFPIAIIDAKGDIKISNSHFDSLFDIQKEKGFWWEKIKNFDVIATIKNIAEKKESIEKEIKIREKFYLCKGTMLKDNNSILLVLIDITAMKEIQEKKREFVTAVSHELKTPLTAIKGYIETIEENTENPENQEFIRIVKHHTERLEKIVEDLITLAQLEKENPDIEMKNVNLVKVAKDVVMLFEKKAKEKGIEITLKYDEIPEIKGDQFRLEQMLINLVDNAVRFTEQGSIKISLSYEKEKSMVKIEVSDTGIGIEKFHIPKIFERFYVVDKARSRKTGGTGLGLSIVKHIVLLHNGTIEVQSSSGKGTTFTINLPV